MAKPSLDGIYSRLRQIPGYHPMSAATFADWSMEAGDSIAIERDGVVYQAPVGNSTVRWNGAHHVNIRSDGNKERKPVSRMSAEKYAGDGAGGGGGTAGIRNSSGLYGYVENLEEQTSTRFEQTDKAISAEATARDKQGRELTGRIDVEAGRISAVVTKDGKIRAGMIVDAINEDSSVTIKADRILLDGNTTINDIFRVSSVGVFVSKPMLVGGSALTSVYIGENRVMAGSFQIRGSSGRGRTLNVVDATVDGNILTITHADGSTENFSKATSLKGAWSGSMYDGKAYRVRAIQEGSDDPVATDVSPEVSKISSMYSYWEGRNLYLLVDIQDAKGESVLRKGVDVTEIYNDGKGSVTPESHTDRGAFACSVSGHTGDWTVTLTRTWSSGYPPFTNGSYPHIFT